MEFRAFEGISRCYLMLGTFAMRPPREMYCGFLEAHTRAVALGGMTSELRGDRAQGLHVFELKFAEAESELLIGTAGESEICRCTTSGWPSSMQP